MKVRLVTLLFITMSVLQHGYGQKKLVKNINEWQQCVVNLETEGPVFSKYQVEETLKKYKQKGYSKKQLDSARNALDLITSAHTGTAIYVKDNNRHYLITAKHVLLDSAATRQKMYEQKHELAEWKDVEAVYNRISIRTPLTYSQNKIINNRAVYNYTHNNEDKLPYILLPDVDENDLAIISLQEKNYKLLDDILQQDGYKPISIDKVNTEMAVSPGDDVFTIGYPENISVVGKVNVSPTEHLSQLNQVITPFTSFGKISMSNKLLNYFYADLTISFGNSGGPVIRNNKLIGIVSGVNKYSIINNSANTSATVLPSETQQLYGVGNLVKVVKCRDLLKYLKILQAREDSAAFNK